ncbi:small GTP-binding protein [Ammonifex degensii KC4]|uniref:Small GTP-binding protein n=1 Tax=Ammonifex degensii (strain DSM 10501 / KC4) TaxID=429009 RepID=C9RDD0_AMMDK|nr:ferrous iron transporter B [Ammonifex degensii]ACX52257.1 small GTP-binding protein [Ammonifex degensii KC4]
MKVLLVGNPNVGKSVIFAQLTGTRVISSNYPGTTVEYTKGYLDLNGEKVEIIDVPGTYSLDPSCKAEEVAVSMLSEGDIIVNVVDATNLERNLYLTLELLERPVPVIIALNLWDEAQHKGIEIDVRRLEEILGVPVVPTAATSGRGLKELVRRLPEARLGKVGWQTVDERYATVGRIVREVQRLSHRHHTLLERLEDLSVHPVGGLFLALIVLHLTFKLVRFVGEGLINWIFDPFFTHLYAPLLTKLSNFLGGQGFVHDLLIGQLVNGKVDFVTSLGLLSTGLYVPLVMVLPYIIAFYAVLGFLEDLGYLPRLAVLLDGLMHSLGLHGYAIVPMVLGLGCNVPAALAIRNLESRRQKFIASTLTVIAVPCFSQTAMIFALVGAHGGFYLAQVFLTLFAVWLVLGLLLNRFMTGYTPALLMEIPPYRLPNLKAFLKKLNLRLSHFLREAVPLVILGILLVNLIHTSGLSYWLARIFSPVFGPLFGLPGNAVITLFLGFLRKDVALGILAPLNLSPAQLTVASTILAVYFPCIATFLVLLRELGWVDMLRVTGIMLVTALIVGIFSHLTLVYLGLWAWAGVGLLVLLLLFEASLREKLAAGKEETQASHKSN